MHSALALLPAAQLENDSEFTHTLNTAFGAVINTHARISEYLSIYIDHAIRNHLKDQTSGDIEEVTPPSHVRRGALLSTRICPHTLTSFHALWQIFDRAIRLFRLLREKDVFERSALALPLARSISWLVLYFCV